MTSTVLDVTVLLLCVSASVVALGASDAGGPDGPTASDAADRLVTETATVTYADADAPNGTRRVHATRAELLALIVERDADSAFDRRATESVRTGVGPRTRVDVTVETDGEAKAADAVGSVRDGSAWNPTATATAQGVDGSPVFRTRDTSGPAWTEEASYPLPIADDAVPAWAAGERAPDGSSTDPSNSVAVGPEPPRNADVTAAVVRQPIPAEFEVDSGEVGSAKGVVRIVVRRW